MQRPILERLAEAKDDAAAAIDSGAAAAKLEPVGRGHPRARAADAAPADRFCTAVPLRAERARALA